MHHHCRQVGLHHDEEDRRDDARYAAVTEYLNETRTLIGAGLLLHGSGASASLFRLSVVPSNAHTARFQDRAFWRNVKDKRLLNMHPSKARPNRE